MEQNPTGFAPILLQYPRAFLHASSSLARIRIFAFVAQTIGIGCV